MPKEEWWKKTEDKKGNEKVSEKGKETLLGILDSAVVGLQYHHGEAAAGEEVYLEREPENTHDPRAVRVDTQDFHALGYLPRRDAALAGTFAGPGACARRCPYSRRRSHH